MSKTTRLRNGVIAIAALAVAGAGCASLLGDFESTPANGEGDDGGNPGSDGSPGAGGTVGPGDDGGTDGSSDGNTTDAPVDGGNDAGLLTCTFSAPNPLMIDSREGAASSLYRTGAVVLARGDDIYVMQPGVNGNYTLWWVLPSDPNNPIEGQISGATVDTGGQVYAFQRVTGGAGLVRNFQLIGPGGPSYYLSVFGDGQPAGDPADGSASLTPNMPSGLSGVGFGFTESAPSTYAWSVFGQLPNQDGGGLVWAGTSLPDGGMTSNLLASTPFYNARPFVTHEGAMTRVFIGSDPTQGSAVALKVADSVNGKDGGSVVRPLGVDGGPPTLLLTPPEEVAGGLNVSMLDINVNATLTGSFHVGNVPTAKLDTFTSSDLPVAIANIPASELPVGGGQGAWAGDDLILLGYNPLLTAGSLNLIWLDVQGHVRAKQTGTSGLLTGHSVDHASIALHQKFGSALAKWHVVWSEQKTPSDGGAAYDVLYYDELVCD